MTDTGRAGVGMAILLAVWLLASLLLSGCGKIMWKGGPLPVEPGNLQERVAQFKRDDYECKRDSQVAGRRSVPTQRSNDPFGTASTNMLDASAGLGDALQSKQMYVLCMESKGYTKQ